MSSLLFDSALDRLVEYAVGPVPETVSVVNPARRKLESGIRAPTAEVNRGKAQFGALSTEGPLEAEPMTHYKIRKSNYTRRSRIFSRR